MKQFIIDGMNAKIKRQEEIIMRLSTQNKRMREALGDCIKIAKGISSGDVQTGLAAKAIDIVCDDALKEVGDENI